MSWWGAFTALFWAALFWVAVLHHVTWSINSICHMIGDRPFAAAGKAHRPPPRAGTAAWALATAPRRRRFRPPSSGR